MVVMDSKAAKLGRSRRLVNEYTEKFSQVEKDIYIIISRIMSSIICYIKRHPVLRPVVMAEETPYPFLMGQAWLEHKELAREKRFGFVISEDLEEWERTSGELGALRLVHSVRTMVLYNISSLQSTITVM